MGRRGTEPHAQLALQKWLQECGLPSGGRGERLWPASQSPLTPAGQTELRGGPSGCPEGLGQSKTKHRQTWVAQWPGPHRSTLTAHYLLELLRGCVVPPEIKRGTHSWLLREPPHPQAADPGLRVRGINEALA